MVFFVSDMHFGRGTQDDTDASETALIACLRAHASAVDHLCLLGDVFDEYIEYRRVIPKGCTRFLGLLAEWSDRHIPITYVVGNHDPWHRDYFHRELGVRIIQDAVIASIGGQKTYLCHGDGIGPSNQLYRWLKPWLRHPLPVWLYRTLLPADMGMALAQWINRSMEKDSPDPVTITSLRGHARHILSTTAARLVVMGHTHSPELIRWQEGAYLNTGSWYPNHIFATADTDGIHLWQWKMSHAKKIATLECNNKADDFVTCVHGSDTQST